ncbi:TerB family tellurite resistance protein [Mesonia aestuariivivens]|uniref:TerB family tellurite resistance protein n=1 Tax=Mesonia aestuariivivens TaxID=2796128 RepID=A0ABS6W2A5_9FLAO|nr:TerB family tellurite resistance protein [Mesonia aestuariivivens]MBW2961682.1 TerB family tellurite resistance protein [Mesonia aestuariivivens]
MIKWVLAVLGFVYMRLPGAVMGFILGTLLELFLKKGGSAHKSVSEMFGQEREVSMGDFELNLLTLSTIVVKADGKVSQKELDYVRSYFVSAYGKERANSTFRAYNEVVKNRQIDAGRICAYLHMRTTYEVRLQILHFLFGIAHADGDISKGELQQLAKIAGHLRLGQRDFESIKAMFNVSGRAPGDTSYAYKILEIDKNVSNAEVKKAYRTMVKKYHPDKLQHMDEVHQKGAREKFNNVQEAYEQIQKERGF